MGAFSRSGFSALAFSVDPDPVANSYGRMLVALFPPGKVWNFVSGELVNLITGCADELARVHARVTDLIEETDPNTTSELLPEFESELGLDAVVSTDERRARIVARLIARQRFRPVDFRTALAPLLGQDPADVVVIERTRAFAILVGNDREIFRFFIYRNPALPGTYFLASAQDLLDTIKPSHTVGHVIESISMLCDDAFSLCDRDILGI
jgi:hypothetical protein